MAYARLIASAMLTLFVGCASLFSGTQKVVHVTSDPPGALVKLDGVTRGISPAELQPSARSGHTVSIERAGFRPVSVPIERHLSGWFAANLLNGLLPGVIIDYATGALYTLEPSRIDVRLSPIGSRK